MSGTEQMELSSLYSMKFSIETELKSIRMKSDKCEPMFLVVECCIIDALEFKLAGVNGRINGIWEGIQRIMDTAEEKMQKLDEFVTSIQEGETPF